MAVSEMVTEITQEILIKANIQKVFDGLISRLTTKNVGHNRTPMPMKLEAEPEGRWFRDLGNGSGHLWGHVQAIKPPTLLEIHGPLFMSLPVANHLIYRLAETEGGVKITFRHDILGPVPEDWLNGIREGWQDILDWVKSETEV